MAHHIETGRIGEELAVQHLQELGHVILQRNYRHKRSELDIISTYQSILIFTEVKTRHSGRQQHPILSVSPHKQRMLKAGAAQYMQEIDYDWAIRFDVITVVLHDHDHELEHYQDVFF